MTASSAAAVTHASGDAFAADAPAIAIDHLTHRYPARRRQPARVALDDVSFAVHAGEIFGLLGPNGSGKSTLLRILTTLLPLEPGETNAGQATTSASPNADPARVLGHSVRSEPAAVRRGIGVVFQSPSIDGQLTCRENLACHARLYGLPTTELKQRIEEELDAAGLAERGNELAGKLSGGLKRRLEIAKAVLPGPRLVLMDEPDTGLDVAARRRLWEQIGELRDRGVTVVVATHLMDHAEACDRAAVLHEGRLLACESPAALRNRVAGQVVTLRLDPASDADAGCELDSASQRLTERFGPFPDGGEPRVVEGVIRFEHADAASLIPRLPEALDRPIASLTLGRPTLEDAFVHLTGEHPE
ncbi:MAG: ABC transporter ATP-binding protein [Phycisphaeraceae bacterium]